jgi:dolichyl-phosphate beta-glucosyltransferase
MSYLDFQEWNTHPSPKPTLSIVIPAYNEAKRILPTLAAMAISVSSLTLNWELIVSDDGSRDETVALVESLGWQNLRVLCHANTGKGGAVKRGVLAARGEMILFADADNSTPIEEVARLMAELGRGHAIAIGSRAAEGAVEENKSRLRHLVSSLLRGVVRVVSGVQVKDTQCGFKLFSRQAALELFSKQQVSGFSFDLELLYLARKFNLKVAEVPVRWYDAPGSKVNPVSDSLKFLCDLVRIRRDDLLGVYNRPPYGHVTMN